MSSVLSVALNFLKFFCFGFTFYAAPKFFMGAVDIDLNAGVGVGIMLGLYGAAIRIRELRFPDIEPKLNARTQNNG